MIFQKSHSSPSFHKKTTERKSTCGKHNIMQNLLRCRAINKYDPTDPDVKKAEAYFEKSLQLDPHNNGAIYDMGLMYQGMRQPEKALKLFERLISGETSCTSLFLVNALEFSGLCYLELSQENRWPVKEREHFIICAEDMLMNSLRLCRAAVAHFPEVCANPSILWRSYSTMMNLLRKSSEDGTAQHFQKMAKLHELVGKYMEAVNVYQEELKLENISDTERVKAVSGLVCNFKR